MIANADPYAPITDDQLDGLRHCYPNAYRVFVAIRIAHNVDICARLLRGEPVDPDALDPDGLKWARERLLVNLDTCAIDLLERNAA